jgi:hypothetical protein
LIQSLTKFLDKYGLKNKIIAFVKSEGLNFNATTNALKSKASFEYLDLDKKIQGIYFVHAFSNACQYCTSNEKV